MDRSAIYVVFAFLAIAKNLDEARRARGRTVELQNLDARNISNQQERFETHEHASEPNAGGTVRRVDADNNETNSHESKHSTVGLESRARNAIDGESQTTAPNDVKDSMA